MAPFTSAAGASVLLVERNEVARTRLAAFLEAHGYLVTTARDGPTALGAMGSGACSMVITEHPFPWGNRLELLEKAQFGASTIDVIAIAEDPSLGLESLRAGASDFFPKPIDHGALLLALGRARDRQTSERLLREASSVILSTSEIERLPTAIVELSLRAMNADDVSLMLVDEEGKLYVAHSHGLPASARTVAVALRDSIAGRVALTGAPALLSGDLSLDPRFSDLASSRRVLSSIVYPLSSQQRLSAVLNINRMAGKPPFSAADMPRAAFLASQAQLALENARLVRRIVVSERMAAVGQLASGFAHELNNPLSFLLFDLQILRDRLASIGELETLLNRSPGGREVAAWWETARERLNERDITDTLNEATEAASRIRDLVVDVKNFGTVELQHRTTFDMNEALRSALRVAGSLRREIEVTLDLAADLQVYGGPGQISQVFLNLIVNAAHALEGRPEPRLVTIRSYSAGDRAVTEIGDNGPGIDPALQRRVFEPFFTTKPLGKGAGLGLSISRDIVGRHGGELRVESALGHGATFTVSLPRATQ